MSTAGTMNTEPDAAEPGQPPEVALRVVSGHPTPREVAALVTVLSAASAVSTGRTRDEATGATPPGSPGSRWADPAWRLVGPSRDHGGWRGSALQR